MGTASTTTTTRGWSRRKGSNHEIHPFPTRRAAQPAFCSPRLNGPCRPRKTATRSFPELVRYPTTESRLEAMQEHRITWWQQHRNHVAASWREARASLRSLPPGPSAGILRYWRTCSLPGHPVYLLGMLHDHRARKRCFWHALAELRRLK
jgi:hypothetical protein